jgi:Tol biopolymer transport system component
MINKKIGTGWLAVISLVFVFAVVFAFPAIASVDADKLVSMPSFGDIENFDFTPDGDYVVFSADMDTDGVTELYSVPVSGGTPTKLSTGELNFGFIVSPDSNRVVYLQDYKLYSVPVTGPSSASVKISDDVINSGGYYYISPDSQRIVYMMDEPGNYYFVTALYSVPITGGAKTQLNKTLVDGGSINYYYLVFSPDGQYVVYGASQDTVGMNELYSVPVAGPASSGVKLNGALPDGGNVEVYWEYDISPDSARVLYRADQVTAGQKELYSVPVAGPANLGVKLNGSLPDGADVVNFLISPDSSRVVYKADQETDGVNELYSVPILGGSPIKLNHDMEYNKLGLADEVHLYAISPDSSTVVYVGTWVNNILDYFELTFEVSELFSVPISGTGGSEEKLWTPSTHLNLITPVGYPERYPYPDLEAMNAANHPICDLEFNPASSMLVFQPEWPSSLICDLWSVPIDDPGSDERLTELDIFVGGEVRRYQISPDSKQVVYSQDPDDITELYSVQIEGPASASQKLNGPLVEGGEVSDWDLSPDGCHVVYKADQDTLDVNELYIADQPCSPLPPGPGDEINLFLPITVSN